MSNIKILYKSFGFPYGFLHAKCILRSAGVIDLVTYIYTISTWGLTGVSYTIHEVYIILL